MPSDASRDPVRVGPTRKGRTRDCRPTRPETRNALSESARLGKGALEIAVRRVPRPCPSRPDSERTHSRLPSDASPKCRTCRGCPIRVSGRLGQCVPGLGTTRKGCTAAPCCYRPPQPPNARLVHVENVDGRPFIGAAHEEWAIKRLVLGRAEHVRKLGPRPDRAHLMRV